MTRKQQTLSIEQIEEFLTLTSGDQNQTVAAVRDFLKAELRRRVAVARSSRGRPMLYEGSRKERNRIAAAKYRAKKMEK